MAKTILDVDDVKRAVVSFSVGDDADSSQVSPARHHCHVPDIKLDEICDLPCRNFDLDCIIESDTGVGVANCPAIVGDAEWNAFLPKLYPLHLAKLVLQ